MQRSNERLLNDVKQQLKEFLTKTKTKLALVFGEREMDDRDTASHADDCTEADAVMASDNGVVS